MKTKYSLTFFPNLRTENNGLCKIYGRITHNRKKAEFVTNLIISKDDWNFADKHPKNKPLIKRGLSGIESKLDEIVTRLEYEGIIIDAKSIKDYYLGKDKITVGIIEYIDNFADRKQKDESLSVTASLKYRELRTYVYKFIKDSQKVKDINIKKIDFKFITEFDIFLKSHISKQYKRPLAQTTVNKKHEYFRTILRQANHEGRILKNPYFNFKIKKSIPSIKYLSNDELSRLKKIDIPIGSTLDKIRDIFLFTTYSGFRFGDAQSLTMDNIIFRDDGSYESIYMDKQQKNKISVNPIILPVIEDILNKYKSSPERINMNYILPRISNGYFNRKIKELAKRCDIKINVHHHVARHTYGTTILMENGVSLDEVQKWMGHSSPNSTRVYSHIPKTRMLNTAQRLSTIL